MSIKIELNPIVDEKLSFMKTKQSDFLCASPNIAKNRLLKGGFQKWCAILCDYRTENYDEYRQLDYKLELLLDQNDQQDTNNLQLLLA